MSLNDTGKSNKKLMFIYSFLYLINSILFYFIFYPVRVNDTGKSNFFFIFFFFVFFFNLLVNNFPKIFPYNILICNSLPQSHLRIRQNELHPVYDFFFFHSFLPIFIHFFLFLSFFPFSFSHLSFYFFSHFL